ncbi:MAG: hypothetical protein ACSHW7_01410 [Patiriisocius sp.]|uniref:hypothetical protein n=1 Tax=Patiriisocius sp. TaxID=2822396 RepID=UPI003EF1D0CE
MNNALLLIAAGAIFDTIGDVFIKNWIANNTNISLGFGVFFYVVGLSFLIYSFTFKNMVVTSVLFIIFNLILLSMVNFFYFNESFSSKEAVALVLGIAAIILFEFN